MITIEWNPVGHVGPVPINWYGLGWGGAFLVGVWLLRRWAPRYGLTRQTAEDLVLWILFGTMIGARLYFIMQNDPLSYLREPWRVLAIWEGGLAFFGGLGGGIGAGYLYARRRGLSFARLADFVAPAVPIGGAIGRLACGLAGMDYGTPTSLPWGVVYTHPASYAPTRDVPRHPVQFYEMAGDLIIAGILLRLRARLPTGALFLTYLVLFSAFRFGLFFMRGDVPRLALGLTNGHWTALAIFFVSLTALWFVVSKGAASTGPRLNGDRGLRRV